VSSRRFEVISLVTQYKPSTPVTTPNKKVAMELVYWVKEGSRPHDPIDFPPGPTAIRVTTVDLAHKAIERWIPSVWDGVEWHLALDSTRPIIAVPIPSGEAAIGATVSRWPAKRLCEDMLAARLITAVSCAIMYKRPMQSGSRSKANARKAQEEYDALTIAEPAATQLATDSIDSDVQVILVDDMITYGTTAAAAVEFVRAVIGISVAGVVTLGANDGVTRPDALTQRVRNVEYDRAADPIEWAITMVDRDDV
jgi:hypothetical protein